MQTTDTQTVVEDGTADALNRKDCLFETLSNPRRREAVRYLRTHSTEGVALIRDLSEHIAAWENGIEPVDVTYKQRKRVYTSLYQSHLPKLHRYEFVDYDADRGTVELTPQAEQLEMYLEVVAENETPWSEVYLGTSATAAALAAAVWIGAVPFVTPWYALVVCVAVFVALSVAHTVETRRSVI